MGGTKRVEKTFPQNPSSPEKAKLTPPPTLQESDDRFAGKPVPANESRARWPSRYGADSSVNQGLQAKSHYTQAVVDGCIFNLYDYAHVKAPVEEGILDYIAKIVELFETINGELYFSAQWFYRAADTAIKEQFKFIDEKRVFYSGIRDDNPLGSIVSKITIVQLPANVDLAEKQKLISSSDFYCDMAYSLPYFSFITLNGTNAPESLKAHSDASSISDASSVISSDTDVAAKIDFEEISRYNEKKKVEMTLLDLYCGCGAMSTGLCLGANMGGVNLVTVRNENAEDFLALLKEWKKLCDLFPLTDNESSKQDDDDCPNEQSDDDDDVSDDSEIHWKGYGSDEDTWEPQDGLGTCKDAMKKFVINGYRSKILPLPGDVDVICGGPPCQGISGFNRFRNKNDPLQDPKNKQLTVFMDFVKYLKPRFVLMENVVDMLKFAGGFLGRYSLGCLVGMNYQARLGIMAAGAYGLPQFRMRVFLWGAHSSEKLPQYPLPTHNVVLRGRGPTEFEGNVVAYEEDRRAELKKELFLKDAISDLPPVENEEARDQMPYQSEAMTEFQQFIRLGKDELLSCSVAWSEPLNCFLFDHRPLRLNDNDYQSVCQIPKRKGANFRDLKGVQVCVDNKKVEWDPDVERVYLASGKPLVPNYAMTFVGGTSSKPFGRLWWDETMPTVVTRAEPHNQVILHPEQDRVLTVRENARLQGFPDYYKLFGTIKERYIQVGNAVAVPVSRALGYALAIAAQGLSGEEPVFALPEKFPRMQAELLPVVEDFL